MKKHLLWMVLAAVCCLTVVAENKAVDKMALATTPRSGLDENKGWRSFWKPRYEQKLKQAQADGDKVQIIFVGDSITNFWDTTGRRVWAKNFAPYHALNLGFSGDRTQQMLWVIEDGKIFGKLHPKLVVMMIGTNNLGWHESGPVETVAGIRRALDSIRRLNPEAKIVLFAVFPRGKDKTDAFRSGIDQINREIAKFADGKHIFFESINNQLMKPDGVIEKSMMPDYLHPAEKGYVIWANALKPYVEKFVVKK